MEEKKPVANQSVTSGSNLASMFKMIPTQDYDELPVAEPGELGDIVLVDKDKKKKESGG